MGRHLTTSPIASRALSTRLIHRPSVSRYRQVPWLVRFATERTGNVLARIVDSGGVRMRDRAKRSRHGAWRCRSRCGGEYGGFKLRLAQAQGRRIMLKEIETHREQIAELCRRYGVKRLELFGSAARGKTFLSVGACLQAKKCQQNPAPIRTARPLFVGACLQAKTLCHHLCRTARAGTKTP